MDIYTEENYMKSPIGIEEQLFKFFNKNRELIIFDIGSCDGLDSIKYANYFPNSKIFAFEPISKNVELIKKNIISYNKHNISVFPIALCDKIGKQIFYLSSGKPEDFKNKDDWDFGNKSSSLLEPDKTKEVHKWLEFNDTEEVTTSTLLNFCFNEKISSIDLIHMDVQGAELKVLEGAGSLLKQIKMIWLEVENITLYKNQPLKEDVEDFMTKNGYVKIKDTVNSIAGDQLWVNLKFFPKKKLTHLIWNLYSKLSSK